MEDRCQDCKHTLVEHEEMGWTCDCVCPSMVVPYAGGIMETEILVGEVARLRGALMNVMMMLNHGTSPAECAEWINDVLAVDLTDDSDDDNDEFYHHKGKA